MSSEILVVKAPDWACQIYRSNGWCGRSFGCFEFKSAVICRLYYFMWACSAISSESYKIINVDFWIGSLFYFILFVLTSITYY